MIGRTPLKKKEKKEKKKKRNSIRFPFSLPLSPPFQILSFLPIFQLVPTPTPNPPQVSASNKKFEEVIGPAIQRKRSAHGRGIESRIRTLTIFTSASSSKLTEKTEVKVVRSELYPPARRPENISTFNLRLRGGFFLRGEQVVANQRVPILHPFGFEEWCCRCSKYGVSSCA